MLKPIDYIKCREQKLINKIIVLLLKTNHLAYGRCYHRTTWGGISDGTE